MLKLGCFYVIIILMVDSGEIENIVGCERSKSELCNYFHAKGINNEQEVRRIIILKDYLTSGKY